MALHVNMLVDLLKLSHAPHAAEEEPSVGRCPAPEIGWRDALRKTWEAEEEAGVAGEVVGEKGGHEKTAHDGVGGSQQQGSQAVRGIAEAVIRAIVQEVDLEETGAGASMRCPICNESCTEIDTDRCGDVIPSSTSEEHKISGDGGQQHATSAAVATSSAVEAAASGGGGGGGRGSSVNRRRQKGSGKGGKKGGKRQRSTKTRIFPALAVESVE
jgi:hypothetical protein